MKRVLLVLSIILVLVATYVVVKKPQEISSTSSEMTQVTYVVDGDTVEVTGGRRVRYIDVNAPEIAHPGQKEECFGIAAKNENNSLVNGQTVRLVSDVGDKDTYGRLLRYVYVGNEFINDTLVRQGFAVAEPIKPDTEFAKQFLFAQQEAKQMDRGLWNACP